MKITASGFLNKKAVLNICTSSRRLKTGNIKCKCNFSKTLKKDMQNSGVAMIAATIVLTVLIVFAFSLILVSYTVWTTAQRENERAKADSISNSLAKELDSELTQGDVSTVGTFANKMKIYMENETDVSNHIYDLNVTNEKTDAVVKISNKTTVQFSKVAASDSATEKWLQVDVTSMVGDEKCVVTSKYKIVSNESVERWYFVERD